MSVSKIPTEAWVVNAFEGETGHFICTVAIRFMKESADACALAYERALKTEGVYNLPGASERALGRRVRRGQRAWRIVGPPSLHGQEVRVADLRKRFPGLDERGQFVQVAGPIPIEP